MEGLLNKRQKRFADEYVITLNATDSAIKAGYSPKTARTQGSFLLTNVNIKAYIEARMKEKDDRLIADQDEVLQSLTRQARRKETDYQVVVLKTKTIKDGVVTEKEEAHVVETPTRNSDTIRSLELIGRRYALFTDKVDQTNTNIEIEVGEWPDED